MRAGFGLQCGIPGAQDVPFRAMLDPGTGSFLVAETIIKVLDERAPGWASKPLIASCGSGYSATVVLLALTKIDSSGALFDGFFAAWKQDPDGPVTQSLIFWRKTFQNWKANNFCISCHVQRSSKWLCFD